MNNFIKVKSILFLLSSGTWKQLLSRNGMNGKILFEVAARKVEDLRVLGMYWNEWRKSGGNKKWKSRRDR